jgi:hypothetical protein
VGVQPPAYWPTSSPLESRPDGAPTIGRQVARRHAERPDLDSHLGPGQRRNGAAEPPVSHKNPGPTKGGAHAKTARSRRPGRADPARTDRDVFSRRQGETNHHHGGHNHHDAGTANTWRPARRFKYPNGVFEVLESLNCPSGEVALSFTWASIGSAQGGFFTGGNVAVPPHRPIITNGVPTGYEWYETTAVQSQAHVTCAPVLA